MKFQQFISASLEQDHSKGMTRKLNYFAGKIGSSQLLEGKRIVMLSSNNYLGLADNESILLEAYEMAKQFGTGSCASRTISGSLEIHKECERVIQNFKNSDAALLFANGYMANLAVMTSIPQKGDLILSDELNHASIIDGCRLSKADVKIFKHKDIEDLKLKLEDRDKYKNVFLVTDGVFSMDGDIAPLNEYVKIAKQFEAVLMVDDAHGVGVIGHRGLGTASHCNVESDVDITIGTLGKAIGCYGAYVTCSTDIKQYLINRARPFIFSTSLPPMVVATVISAIRYLHKNADELVSELNEKTSYYRMKIKELEIDTCNSETNIVPLLTGDIPNTMRVSKELLDNGVFAFGIRPPAVPEGKGRLRTTIIRTHTYEEMDFAIGQIKKQFKK